MSPRSRKKKPAPKKADAQSSPPSAQKAGGGADVIKPDMTMQEAAAHVLRMMRSGMKMDLRD